MKSLNATKSHRLLDFVPSIRPSFLSVMLVFVCGCLWLKNETTNERLIALESRIDYLSCVNMVKRASFEKMTRSSTKVTSKDLYKKMRKHFSEGNPHTSGKIGAVCWIILSNWHRQDLKSRLSFLRWGLKCLYARLNSIKASGSVNTACKWALCLRWSK